MIKLDYKRFTLDNGLQLIVHEDPSVPLAAVNLWYRVGSKDERPGRTGFAHLFEHLMFEGSAHVPSGQFDEVLESVGGVNNGSTSTDRTNYWETVPSNALELALFLEADRMGALTMTQEKLDAQRDVVKNERRQSYENRPYGLAFETIHKLIYPPTHPYHWPIIGWMEDLDAATLDDVVGFFRTYYAPNNASLAVAGAVSADDVLALVEKHFAAIPAATPPAPGQVPAAQLDHTVFETIEDEVHLPRIYICWHSPAVFEPGDAELDVFAATLTQGKTARLYHALVYERGIAQDVEAFQSSALLGSLFNVVVTARPGVALPELYALVMTELESTVSTLDAGEVERSVRRFETSFVDSLQTVGGFGGRADRLNYYATYLGDPGYAQADLDRFLSMTVQRVVSAARTHVIGQPAVVLSVVPKGQRHTGVRV